MRKLVLYSDRVIAANQQVDWYLLQLLGTNATRIGYISSSSDPKRQYFTVKQQYYQQYGLEALYVELDVAYKTDLLDELFACDGIHLSGGNTFYFLYWLQQRGLMERLQHYAEHQGAAVMMGMGL